jgi:hypothetical protein
VRDGKLYKGLDAYSFLAYRARCLDVVIRDLTALARLYPREPQLWKTLGDALVSSGNQSYADKAYAQADIAARIQEANSEA